MKRKQTVIASVGVALVLALAAVWFVRYGPGTPTAADVVATKGERKILYWHDPMVPGTKFDRPGKSPFMDMQLVPVYEDEADGGATVTIRPEIVNNLGVRTYKIERVARARRLVMDGYLFRSEGRATLRVQADIFDRDIYWLRPGLPAELRVLGLPDRHWEATVEAVGTDIDIGARGRKATLRLTQTDPALRPGMFAHVTILAVPAGKKLFVPREALIRSAARTALVLALGEGRFQPVDVVAGVEDGEWIEILKGAQEGDVVVTSGQFLIDSEAGLRASFQRMQPAPAVEPPEAR